MFGAVMQVLYKSVMLDLQQRFYNIFSEVVEVENKRNCVYKNVANNTRKPK